MNERIRELKQQAIDYVDSVDDGLGIEHYRELVDQKFAELIVRECVFISRTSANGFSAGDRMKEHFGVN